ncbi:DUF2239 family protein [Saccharibacillus deserti]|uniref:DUF2239 family protein n=1 Tax=Saccharibacillus deserti TaxID=1634444 RepID=UPI00155442E9|nr:DUF2239 family protein [Saccharibacillus deserti]
MNTMWNDRNDQELEYDSRKEAEDQIKLYQMMLPDQVFYIHELGVTGRPSIGVTRKVSLTLTDEDWERFDDQANGNRPKYLRKVLTEALDGRTDKEQMAKQLAAYAEFLYDQSRQEKEAA